MALKIYNTLTRKKEEFETIEPGKVRMYVCGPTVYNKAHIGHAMSALVFDIIRRYLEYCGYAVTFVMNFTDVDDKIIARANQQGVDPFLLAEQYIQEYQRHLDDLNVLPASINPRATREIDRIIAMISGLIESGHAYPAGGDVYFRVTCDPDYGKLSGRRLDDMQAGARIEVGELKEHPMDFALWKGAKPGEPAWDSPWGPGRPGWHIECSAMSLHHLGEQIDIHGGGNDLIFPHHENEIAQTESLTGKSFARYWVHNGMLQLGGEKMSKSLGNLVTIEEFLANHSADVFRLLILNSSYRGPLTYTDDVVAQAERGLDRLHSALKPALPGGKGLSESQQQMLLDRVNATRVAFEEAMNDDFNSAGALAALFELVRSINQARADGAQDSELEPAQSMLRKLAGVLGLTLSPAASQGTGTADPFVDLLVEIRSELRKQKLWALSDLVRNRLQELGVVLEDSKDGTTWHWDR
ncbi:MAG TPA: cysteine--tRNA ligase [Anaerolineaceae bacterium]|nr:cysteine--tRNA ligase [Anaerolineaceae bacterium]